jgi:hypothetical protein
MHTLPGKKGAWGLVPYGRSQYGSKASDVEPRFETSIPNDGQHNVPVTQALKFTTYCFSSFVEIENIRLEISEDGGGTYAPAFDGISFVPPYSGRVRRPDGQRITFYIVKASDWPPHEHVLIRFSGADEFEQEATKVPTVKWAT